MDKMLNVLMDLTLDLTLDDTGWEPSLTFSKENQKTNISILQFWFQY